MVETTVFPLRKSLFLANWERTRVGGSTSCILALVVMTCYLSCIFEARLVFSGRPPLGYDILLWFCCLASSCAPFISDGSLLGTVQTVFSCFLMSWAECVGFGWPAMLLFSIADAQGHTFVPAGAARPPTRRRIGWQSQFPPPPLYSVVEPFLLFRIFWNDAFLWKLSSRRGAVDARARFWGPRVAQNAILFDLDPPSKTKKPGALWKVQNMKVGIT